MSEVGEGWGREQLEFPNHCTWKVLLQVLSV